MYMLTEAQKKELLDAMERYFAFYEANDDDEPVSVEANDALIKGMEFFNALRRVPTSDGPSLVQDEEDWESLADDDDDDLFLSTSVLAKLKGKK